MLRRCLLQGWRTCLRVGDVSCASVRSKHNDTWETIGRWGEASLEGMETLRLYVLGMTKQFDTSPENMRRTLLIRQRRRFRQQQLIAGETIDRLGSDVAVAEMVLRLGGAVKFEGSNQWLRGSRNQLRKRALLPRDMVQGPSANYKLEVIDLSHCPVMYEGLSYLRGLRHLRYLSLRGCAFVDDHCMSQLHHVRRSLAYLDLSYCPYVSARGLTTLWSQKQLQRLCVEGMTLPELREDKELACVLLEERNENLYIDGVDYNLAMKTEARRQLVLEKEEKFRLGSSVGADGKLLDAPSPPDRISSQQSDMKEEEVTSVPVGRERTAEPVETFPVRHQ